MNITASAIARKLNKIGFEKWNGKYGYFITTEAGRVIVSQDNAAEIATELTAMGYEVRLTGCETECHIYGKANA
jgi:hypothetical protein